MNDLTGNPWISPMQQSCPNCQPPVAATYPSNAANSQNSFQWWQQGIDSNAETASRIADTTGVPNQQMISAGINPNQLGRSTALTSPAVTSQQAQAIPGGLPPTESTSNIADLGLSAQSTTFPQTGRQENPITLTQLTSGQPELPGLTAINLNNQPTAINLESLQYLNGFMLTQLGRSCTVTFLIGTSTMDVRSGTLVGVGANYILINEFETNDIVACDFYSIKFVKFYY